MSMNVSLITVSDMPLICCEKLLFHLENISVRHYFPSMLQFYIETSLVYSKSELGHLETSSCKHTSLLKDGSLSFPAFKRRQGEDFSQTKSRVYFNLPPSFSLISQKLQ